MSKEKRLVFYIDAYSPETIPMAKLAEYMADLAALLGRDNAVHFARLETGSTKIVALVEYEDFPKVRTRLANISRGNWDKETAKLVRAQIDHRLANDNAIGRIYFEDIQGHQAPDMSSSGPYQAEAAELRPLQSGRPPGRPVDFGRRQG